jgi:hypothetical protein
MTKKYEKFNNYIIINNNNSIFFFKQKQIDIIFISYNKIIKKIFFIFFNSINLIYINNHSYI